jgi:hypothetical protein
VTLDFDQWQRHLTQLISTALCEFRGRADEEMERFALDCHPWNGLLVLAFLTESELKDAPFLSEPTEMASWKLYDFGAGLACWHSVLDVTSRMRTVYEEAGNNRSSVAMQLFKSCARAVASQQVQDVLSTYRWAKGIRITIPHPDTGEEYYPPI